MSFELKQLCEASKNKIVRRDQILALRPKLKYDDGRTVQAYKDECDINKIMARFAQTNTISHLSKYAPMYGDFADFDFQTATQKLTEGREIFDALPSEIRREFHQSPAAFFSYVNDPQNKGKLKELLPDLAKPGTQMPKVAPLASPEPPPVQKTTADVASEPLASGNKPPDPPTGS